MEDERIEVMFQIKNLIDKTCGLRKKEKLGMHLKHLRINFKLKGSFPLSKIKLHMSFTCAQTQSLVLHRALVYLL